MHVWWDSEEAGCYPSSVGGEPVGGRVLLPLGWAWLLVHTTNRRRAWNDLGNLLDNLHRIHIANTHLYSPPAWMCMCLARFPFRENAMPHVTQTYGFSPVWVRRCKARLLDVENAFSHVTQTCGLPPVWVRRCTVRLLDVWNVLPHVSHTCGFSPVWVRMCTHRWPDVENALEHVSQAYGLSPECVRM